MSNSVAKQWQQVWQKHRMALLGSIVAAAGGIYLFNSDLMDSPQPSHQTATSAPQTFSSEGSVHVEYDVSEGKTIIKRVSVKKPDGKLAFELQSSR